MCVKRGWGCAGVRGETRRLKHPWQNWSPHPLAKKKSDAKQKYSG
jgi:hypothetical protein